MDKNNEGKHNVEVAYAAANDVHVTSVILEAGATVRDAILCSGIIDRCPEIDLQKNRVGIFSKICDLNTPVYAGCRVEIYRPLQIDPKQARRNRAASAK